MSAAHRLSRPLLAAPYLAEGIATLRDPAARAKTADRLPQLAAKVGVPGDTTRLVQVLGGVKTGAGVLLALGKARRLSAMTLIGTSALDIYTDGQFWSAKDPDERERQLTRFVTSAGLAGGLLLDVVDRGGAPSLGWRARTARRRADRRIRAAQKVLAHRDHQTARRAQAQVADRLRQASQAAAGQLEAAPEVAERFRAGGHNAARQLQHAGGQLASGSRQLVQAAHLDDAAHAAAGMRLDDARQLAERLRVPERVADVADRAGELHLPERISAVAQRASERVGDLQLPERLSAVADRAGELHLHERLSAIAERASERAGDLQLPEGLAAVAERASERAGDLQLPERLRQVDVHDKASAVSAWAGRRLAAH